MEPDPSQPLRQLLSRPRTSAALAAHQSSTDGPRIARRRISMAGVSEKRRVEILRLGTRVWSFANV